MKYITRLFVILLSVFILLLTGCSSKGGSSSVHYGVYGGYGYPYYGYGYSGCCSGRPAHPVQPHPGRPTHPVAPGRPTIQPMPKSRPSTGMGRPSTMPRGGGRR